MPRHNVIVALDIGTSKICCLIAEVSPDKKIEIIGKGFSISKGIKKGIIIDIDEVARSIDTAIIEAEKIAGFEVSLVLAGIKSGYLTSFNNPGFVEITSASKVVTSSDVRKAIEAAQKVELSPDQDIIQAIPRYFSIDGQSHIKNPVGMNASELEADVHLVIGLASSVQNIIKSIKKSDLELKPNGLIFEPAAGSLATSTPQEKDLGIVFADIGAGTTDIVIYKEGYIQSTLVLPVGGNHITYDLAVALRIPLEEAERLKINYGCALSENLDSTDEEVVQAVSLAYKDSVSIPRKKICEIIHYRLIEILELIKKQVDKVSTDGIYLAGAVLTGGVSLTCDINKLAESIIGLPARTGYPPELRGLADVVKNPIYSAGVGLLVWGVEYQSRQDTKVRPSKTFGLIRRFLNWLSEIF